MPVGQGPPRGIFEVQRLVTETFKETWLGGDEVAGETFDELLSDTKVSPGDEAKPVARQSRGE